jgi:hypothetical protein
MPSQPCSCHGRVKLSPARCHWSGQALPSVTLVRRAVRTFACLRSWSFFSGVLFACASLAQSILAGEHGTNDHYVDVEPDVSLSTGPFMPPGYYAVDIDQDGDTDVELNAYHSGGMGGYDAVVYVTCLAGAAIAQGGALCSDLSAKGFEAGQVIDATAVWSSSSTRLAYIYVYQGQTQCTFNSFTGDRYLGTRLVIGQDVLYGWIRISATTSPSFTVREHACTTAASGITATTLAANGFFYDLDRCELNISLGTPASDPWRVDLYDVQGRSVAMRVGAKGGDRMILAINGLAAGVYTLTVRSSSGIMLSGRFAVMR